MQSPHKELVSNMWIQANQPILESIMTSCMSSFEEDGGFNTDAGCLYNCSMALDIPSIEPEHVEVDVIRQVARLNIFQTNDFDSEMSASSIGDIKGFKITANEMRKFVHDFTFGLFADSTDSKLKQTFPVMSDGFDDLTPDIVQRINDFVMVVEFSTTSALSDKALKSRYQDKINKYYYPIDVRYKRLEPGHTELSLKVSLSAMVVSERSAILPLYIPRELAMKLTNELTARFRFAKIIVDMARSNGMTFEDNDTLQMDFNMMNIIELQKPRWQKEGGFVRVPLTEARVITNDVSESEAYKAALLYYKRGLEKVLPKTVSSFTARLESDGAVQDDETLESLTNLYKKNHIGTREDRKVIIQLPNVAIKDRYGWLPIPSHDSDPDTDFIDSLITATHEPNWSFDPDVEKMERLAMMTDSEPEYVASRLDRRKYKRIKKQLTSEQKVLFAESGVLAKSRMNESHQKDVLKQKKEPFSMNSPTDDVEDFIWMESLNIKGDGFLLPSQDMVMDLIRDSIGLHGDDNLSQDDHVRLALGNPMVKWATLCSTIAQELAISIKQNVDSDEWIFKRLLEFDCVLIVKPTNSSSHIFYRLIFPRDVQPLITNENSRVLRDLKRSTTYSYTDWMSYTVEKLTNIIKLDVFIISMLAQWSRHYRIAFHEGLDDPRVWRMTRLCLLVSAEDRSKTEEIMTLFRYISMEKFSLLVPNNSKMVGKLPTILRSRLEVWVINKMLKAMSQPNYTAARNSETEFSYDESAEANAPRNIVRNIQEWKGMENPYTGESISDPAKLIELYYLGYATNKDAKAWQNTEMDLIKKIIKEENKMESVDPDHCGMYEAEVGEYGPFEWSRLNTVASADIFKAMLKKNYGLDWEKNIETKIIKRFTSTTWEYLATLKASSIFDPNDNESGITIKKKTGEKVYRLTREKVAIRVLNEMGNYEDRPMLSLSSFLEEFLDDDEGLVVDIFKKNQHGGLREIYVLELKSRLIQFAIEELSRALCAELPNEVMMHPEMKIQKPQDHMYRAATTKYPYRMNISSSNDAKVWNQSHHVAKFAQFLCRILPESWHGLIVNILKTWTVKKIRLPDGVLNMLHKHPNMETYDDIHSQIVDAYRGLAPTHWLPTKGRNYIVIESGMMQGLLHYLSSLYHGCILMMRDHFWKVLAAKMSVTSMTTDLVSSDDSSRMTDVLARDPKLFMKSVLLTLADHNNIGNFSNSFGIVMSEKSTICSTSIMEFNSEFFLRASLVRPSLKWVLSALNLTTTESFMERFEGYYSLAEQQLSGGSGYQVAHLIQICQAILHYKMMGSSVNPLFNRYCSKLVEIKDPALGYMPLDPPIIAGLPGLQYSLWNLTIVSNTFNRISKFMITDKDRTSTSTGAITKGVTIKHGDWKKWKRLFAKIQDIEPGWMDKINKDPEVLYKLSETKFEAKLKIITKLTSPGVSQSLSRGNEVANNMASSAYLINGLAVTLGSNWISILDSMKPTVGFQLPRSKVSLYRLLVEPRLSNDFLSENDMLVLYPQKDSYLRLSNTIKKFKNHALVPTGSTKIHRTTIQVFSQADAFQFSLQQMVMHKWFDTIIEGSPDSVKYVWDSYQSIYPWLQDDPKSTLDHPLCPFTNHIQLHNMISKRTGKPRVINLTGTPVRDSSLRDAVIMSIQKNQVPGLELYKPGAHIETHRNGASVLSGVARILDFPLVTNEKLHQIGTLLVNAGDIWRGGPSQPNDRLAKIGIIQKFLKLRRDGFLSEENKELIVSMIKASRLGVIGGFSVRQKYNRASKKHTGLGIWVGTIDNTFVRISMMDNRLTKIETNDYDRLVLSTMALRGLMSEFRLDDYSKKIRHDIAFDLRGFKPNSFAAEVVINRNLKPYNRLDPNTWDVMLIAGKLALVHIPDARHSDLPIISIVTHVTNLNDTSLAEPVYRSNNVLLRSWMLNVPIREEYATQLLELDDLSYFGVDTSDKEWRTFCKNTISQTLKRYDINMAAVESLLPLITQESTMTPEQFNLFMEDLYDVDITFDVETILVQESVQMNEESFKSFFDDIILPDMEDLLATDSYSPDMKASIRHTWVNTRLWDDWAQGWSRKLSLVDKNLISQGYTTTRLRNLTDILHHYVKPSGFKDYRATPSRSRADHDDEDEWKLAFRS